MNTAVEHSDPSRIHILPINSYRELRSKPALPRVLLVGELPDLLETRAAIIRSLGADVIYCKPQQAVQVARAQQRLQAVVMCHSVEADRASILVRTLRAACPRAHIVQLLPLSNPFVGRTIGADVVCVAEPYHLAKRIRDLLARRG